MDVAPYRSFMQELATRSGEFIRPFFGRPDLVVETKSDASPVTAADRGAEELLRQLIAAKFPAHGILGEELGAENTDAEFVWVLDPIDGTKSFITGVPLWGTLIALLHDGQPILGCIHQPILGQLLLGDGATTTLNDRPVRCRAVTRIEEATLLTSDPFNPAKYQNRTAFEALAARARLVRTWGDCYGYLLVASGYADVMLDPIMNPWDIAALVPIIRGAGGTITDWQGAAPFPAESTIAAAPGLHAEVVAALRR
ncbi:histidinol-phosphatase [Horticoccus luteus]|uniref:Histidinol-phosphatase n=1 Tax=Horticoccus luteus TaxID=2862869 RepID=A0A8F9TU32_9BACT|nr:histidinol-phosphatase [Horticoccus luteus]QYM78140.1 histidinol-phosphatase [Horticoccus luteus]